MKKISIACLAGLLFFVSCENENSSTVGTYDSEDTSPSLQDNEGAANTEQLKEKIQAEPMKDSTAADTSKTTMGAAGKTIAPTK